MRRKCYLKFFLGQLQDDMEEQVGINWEEVECTSLDHEYVTGIHRMTIWYGFGRITLKPACQALRTWPDNPFFGAFFTNSLNSTSCWSHFPHCDVFLGRTAGTCRQFSSMIKHVWAASTTSTYKRYKSIWRWRCGVQVFISDKRRRLCLPLATHISEYLGDPLDLTRLNHGKGSGHARTGLRTSHLRLSDSWDCVKRCKKIMHTYVVPACSAILSPSLCIHTYLYEPD